MVNQRSDRSSDQLIKSFSSVDTRSYIGPTQHRPNVFANRLPMAPGFYLFTGPTGSGKSTFSLALALVIATTMKVPLSYRYMLEPRAPADDLQKLLGVLAAENTALLIRQIAEEENKYVILDSVTYLIPALGKKLMGDQEDVTMKEGLRRSDILGVLALDNMCRGFGLTVIGTVNSELFPRTDDLEGACEGSITINAAGSGALTVRDRLTRERNLLALPQEAILVARRMLGYTQSFKLENSSLLGKAL